MKHPLGLAATAALLALTLGAQAQDIRDNDVRNNPENLEEPPAPPTSLPQPHEPDPREQELLFQGSTGHAFFGDADADGDGVLSVTEARTYLPGFNVEDVDTDGIVSQAEAEAVIPELRFMERGRKGGDAPVGETEFGMIVTALNEREANQQINPDQQLPLPPAQ